MTVSIEALIQTPLIYEGRVLFIHSRTPLGHPSEYFENSTTVVELFIYSKNWPSPMASALDDELTSINSIYAENTLELIDEAKRVCSLRIPTHSSIVLRIEFPEDYPDGPLSILGTESVGVDAPKGMGRRVVELSREILSQVYRPGEPCVFDLVEELNELLANDEQSQTIKETVDPAIEREAESSNIADLGPEPPWTITSAITEKKSIFISRAAAVTSPDQAQKYLQHLLATDKKVARATHNITAWRTRGADGISYQDSDDDGETAAGGRVLHLMQLMDVWDVMIVVTRWYGGVLLGPDRFRIINSSVRDALIAGGFAQDPKKGKK
jgi:putative IMPACT (imprinted ancient) family translation regulator